MKKLILDLCGGTGSFSKYYAKRKKEYDVEIIDIFEWDNGKKSTGDVRLAEFRKRQVHGIIASPPCTVFANSGARWWKGRSEEEIVSNISIMDACFRICMVHDVKFWVLENPVGKMKNYLGNYRMTFQPNEYAGWAKDPSSNQYTKRTCLWGDFVKPEKKFLPPVLGSKMHYKYGGKSTKTKMMRSMIPDGFARAFFEANR